MSRVRLAAKPLRFALATLSCLAALLIGFAFVAADFGVGPALVLLLFLVPPAFVAVRLRRRWATVRRREVAYLAVLVCVPLGAAVFVVRDWYDKGMHRRYAEDVRWSKLERLMRECSEFRGVRIRVSPKNLHWVDGTVDSEENLDRLKSLAASCGITQPIDRVSVRQRWREDTDAR